MYIARVLNCMLKKLKNIFVPILCAVLLLACGTQQNNNKKVVYVNVPQVLSSLDPAALNNDAAVHVAKQIYSGLVRVNDTMDVVADLALAWEASKDGSTFTFYIKPGLRFQDDPCFAGGKGRIITAADFVYSYNRLFKMKRAILLPLKNAVAHFQDDSYGFFALSENIFQIVLNKPYPSIMADLAMPEFAVIPKEAIDKYQFDFASHPVGCGPYQLFAWEKNVGLILHPNPNYRNFVPAKPLQAISYSFIKQNSSVVQMMKHQQVDVAILPRLKQKAALNYIHSVPASVVCLGFDQNQAASNCNLLLRKAINYAINRTEIMDQLAETNITETATGIIPPAIAGYYPMLSGDGYKFEPERAKALMDEAGYTPGKKIPVIMLNTNGFGLKVARVIKKQLIRLGFTVIIDHELPFISRSNHKDAIILNLYEWKPQAPDADSFLRSFYTTDENKLCFSSLTYNKTYQAALDANRDLERYQIYALIDKQIIDDAMVVPIYYTQLCALVQPWAGALHLNALCGPEFRNLQTTKKMSQWQKK